MPGVGGQITDEEIDELWEDHMLEQQKESGSILRGIAWGLVTLVALGMSGYGFFIAVRWLWLHV